MAYLLLSAALLLAGCNGINPPYTGTFDQVLIYYGMGYNNLSANLRTNLEQLGSGILPGLHQDKAILAFSHNVAVSGNYVTPNPPVLMRIYRGSDGKPVVDTLQVYSDISLSASRETMRRVLDDIRADFPARRYGMVVSSHGTGWLPANYNSSSESGARLLRARPSAEIPDETIYSAAPSRWPATKPIGNQFSRGHAVTWLPLEDFSQALPMHLDYLVIDACLSGAVEVAYALKDCCDYLVLSPTEILTSGMVYTTLSWDMFAGQDPDLLTYCQEYYQKYDQEQGDYRSATVVLVDCARLEALAAAVKPILDAHRDALSASDLRDRTQRYFYSSSRLPFFYDLRDLCAQLGASESELARLDAALSDAVLYHAETPSFFDLSLERCCGLSVYIPEAFRTQLNTYYRTLAWNAATGLVGE